MKCKFCLREEAVALFNRRQVCHACFRKLKLFNQTKFRGGNINGK